MENKLNGWANTKLLAVSVCGEFVFNLAEMQIIVFGEYRKPEN